MRAVVCPQRLQVQARFLSGGLKSGSENPGTAHTAIRQTPILAPLIFFNDRYIQVNLKSTEPELSDFVNGVPVPLGQRCGNRIVTKFERSYQQNPTESGHQVSHAPQNKVYHRRIGGLVIIRKPAPAISLREEGRIGSDLQNKAGWPPAPLN